MGICPGADADSATAKDSQDPNSPPTSRDAAPSGPTAMLITGMRARSSACSVADSSVNTSLRRVGMTCSIATSAPSRSASSTRSIRYSSPGV